MKKDLLELIDSQKEIEKMFHPFDDNVGILFEKISDVPEFQNWFQEIKLELQGIYDRTHDTFVGETINLCGKRVDEFTEKKYFVELVGKLQAIRKNIDKYYPDEKKESSHSQGGASGMKKKPLIFISHSSKNKDQVAKIADLLRSINLSPRRDIFCSSLPGYGIPNGANIFDFLRERFLNYDLHIIFVHSPEYYESPVSLNEMGAAWVLRANATSLLLPGFDFSGMKGVIGSDCIAIKLDGDSSEVKDRLNQLRRELESEFDISDNEDIIWEEARNRFIREINGDVSTQNENISATPALITEEMKQLLKKVAAVTEGQILIDSDLESGTYIQIGSEVVAKEYPDRRKYAVWEEALNACLQAKYIERKSEAVCVITNAGYKAVE
ncbi:toll/interleukin-1 receptor domain-containing protein [Ruminococcus sp. MCC718]|uniref:toll/interleukin-1 receptor domain-containing protein n=1 Tax=Ruminococcus sp. MCC718 TaxID=2592649 RepID=UPI002078F69B|nr:toll/interleukin-1 receptor domain-containing protein [Ruminococcus sp. MCC718]